MACAEVDIAINNGKDQNGNDRPADFIRVVVWDKQAENLKQYQKKGSQIAVDGSIKNQTWDDEQGNKRYKTYVLARNIQYLDNKKSESPLPPEPDCIPNKQEEKDPFTNFNETENLELPF